MQWGKATGQRNWSLRDHGAEPVGGALGAPAAGGRGHDQKLFATDPGKHVAFTQMRAQMVRDLAEHPVTGCVPVAIVDLFEKIEIGQHDGKAFARKLTGFDQLLQER